MEPLLVTTHWNCPARRGAAVCQVDYQADGRTCIHCGEDTVEKGGKTVRVYIMEDIFDGPPESHVAAQQVNARGVMGSGLAKAIRSRYPQVYEHYRAEYELGLLELGYTSYVEVDDGNFIANICGQESFGRDGKQYTNYNALRAGLEDVKMMAHSLGVDVVIPYRIGCGLGGGDWNFVSRMIDEIFSGCHVTTLYQGGKTQ